MSSDNITPLQLRSTDPLQAYLQLLRDSIGAQAVSLYYPSESREILIHSNTSPALPEMSDVSAARRFAGLVRDRRRSMTRPELDKSFSLHPVASTLPRGWLIGVAAPSLPLKQDWEGAALSSAVSQEPARRKGDQHDLASRSRPSFWIGVRQGLQNRGSPHRVLHLLDTVHTAGHGFVSLGWVLARHAQQVSAMLDDPVSGLPGRILFEASLGQSVQHAIKKQSSIVLLLVSPDEFALINEKFGREAGDRVIREISYRLRGGLRGTDLVHHYGGAVFSATLNESKMDEGHMVARKIQALLTDGAYLQGTVRLGFSCGLSVFQPKGSDNPQRSSINLFRRADQALNKAKELGSGQMVSWESNTHREKAHNLDKLSGIFTADVAKDYRNMLLLWDTMTIFSASTAFDDLASKAVDRLCGTFKPRRAGLFVVEGGEKWRLVHGRERQSSSTENRRFTTLDPARENLLHEARRRRETVEARLPVGDDGPKQSCYAVPLITHQQVLGGLFLECDTQDGALDSSDLIFLKTLAGQLTLALDRARLATQERNHEEQERRRLRTELNDLRRALDRSRLVYASPQLEEVLAMARRVAPTEATILITGDSGTGKELLARTVHELSPRRQKPFVVVDCGAIAATLIDSELFGHVRGAYTGAEKRSLGRLAEADEGTLVLDEISEVPLEVQSKLLRFVQAKQFTPVGGNRPRTVNVRLIAVTNRELSQEVAAGRFREDLYYRLNVVGLITPALRERPEDILCLARYFANQFSIQYSKGIQRLSPKAEAHLLRYDWPGNVRELQNRILKAVILCDGQEIGLRELGFGGKSVGPDLSAAMPPVEPVSFGPLGTAQTDRTERGRAEVAIEGVFSAPFGVPKVEPGLREGGWSGPESAMQELRSTLYQELDSALSPPSGSPVALPLGRWLNEDLILEACRASQSVLSRGAELLGIPETTFRRKFRKVQAQSDAGLLTRTPSWDRVRAAIVRVLKTPPDPGVDLMQQLRHELLVRVASRLPHGPPLGAALMGVSEPTFRRWLSFLPPDQTK